MWNEVAHSFQTGDGYIYFMFFLAFLGTVLLFERFIMLQFVFNIDFNKFITNLKKMIKAEDLDRAVNLCRNASHTALPQISLRALEAAETDPTTVRGTIEEETIAFLPRIEARLGFLPAMATLVLLTGILGTIDRLWGAFHSIDILDTAQKQAAVGHGIAGSLTYTTIGLLICMIFLAGHQLLKGLALKLVEKIQLGVTVLHNLLVPQEVAYMPVSGVMEAPAGGMPQEYAEPVQQQASAPTEDSGDNEDFEDASVEDIKDEEEII